MGAGRGKGVVGDALRSFRMRSTLWGAATAQSASETATPTNARPTSSPTSGRRRAAGRRKCSTIWRAETSGRAPQRADIEQCHDRKTVGGLVDSFISRERTKRAMLPSRDPAGPSSRRNIRAASTLDDSRRKREQFTVKIRKEKREAMLQKRRAHRAPAAAAAPAGFAHGAAPGVGLVTDPQQDVPKLPEEIASMKNQVRVGSEVFRAVPRLGCRP